MSNLKKDIEKIWDILGYWKTGKIHIKWWIDEDGCRVDCTDEIAEATTQIINLIESVVGKVIGQDELFEPLPQHIETDDPEILKPIHDTKRDCRNDLRKAQRKTFKDIKSKLIGKE